MARKHVFLLITVVTLTVVVLNFSLAGANDTVACSSQDEGVVEKAGGDAFTVTINFQNTGRAQGNWSVNVSFEGENWSWQGTPKTLTLDADGKKTLVWNGVVPVNASVNSIARLVVYYGDSFKALDWWIRVVQPAELTIKSSSVS